MQSALVCSNQGFAAQLTGVFAAQLMSVEGLTRENVASHLQKYRLQLKKDHRLDEDGNLAEAQVCRSSCRPRSAWYS